MKKLYHYVNNLIRKSSLNLENKILRAVDSFGNTLENKKLEATNIVRSLIVKEFDNIFTVGQVHGFKAVQDLKEVKPIRKTVTKDKIYSFDSYLNDIANFSGSIDIELNKIERKTYRELQLYDIRNNTNKADEFIQQIKQQRTKYNKRINEDASYRPINETRKKITVEKTKPTKLENELDKIRQAEQSNRKPFNKNVDKTVPINIDRLKNFKEYLSKREQNNAENLIDTFTSYPKQVTRSILPLDNVKLELEKNVRDYLSNPFSEKEYIEKIVNLLNPGEKPENILGYKLPKGLKAGVDKKFQEIKDTWANRIRKVAVTELRSAYSIGRIYAYKKAGIKVLVWNAEAEHFKNNLLNKKPRTCKTCFEMNGQEVLIDSVLNGSLAIDPSGKIYSDPKYKYSKQLQAFIPNHPFCACFYLPSSNQPNKNAEILLAEKNAEMDKIINENNDNLGKAVAFMTGVGALGLLALSLKQDIRNLGAGILTTSIQEGLKGIEVFEEEKYAKAEEIERFLSNISSGNIPEKETVNQLVELNNIINLGATEETIKEVIEAVSPKEAGKLKVSYNNALVIQENTIRAIQDTSEYIPNFQEYIDRVKDYIDREDLHSIDISEAIEYKRRAVNDLEYINQLVNDLVNSKNSLQREQNNFQERLNQILERLGLDSSKKSIVLNTFNFTNKLNKKREGEIIKQARELQRKLRAYVSELDTALTQSDINVNQINNVVRVEEQSIAAIKGIKNWQSLKFSVASQSSLFKKELSESTYRSLVRDINFIESILNNVDAINSFSNKDYSRVSNTIKSVENNLTKLNKYLNSFGKSDLELISQYGSSKEAKYISNRLMELREIKNKFETKLFILQENVEYVRNVKNNPKLRSNIFTPIQALTKPRLILELRGHTNTLNGLVDSSNLVVVNKRLANSIKSNIGSIVNLIQSLDSKSSPKSIGIVKRNTFKKLALIEKYLGEASLVIDLETSNSLNLTFNSLKETVYSAFRDLENLNFKRYSNLAEFSIMGNNIIDRELLNYVRKFPTKYNRLSRLF